MSRDSELDQNLSGDLQKNFSSDLNEIWYVGTGRWLMHDSIPYGRNQGQGHSREVDRQSPTGLIFLFIIYTRCRSIQKWKFLNILLQDFLQCINLHILWNAAEEIAKTKLHYFSVKMRQLWQAVISINTE